MAATCPRPNEQIGAKRAKVVRMQALKAHVRNGDFVIDES